MTEHMQSPPASLSGDEVAELTGLGRASVYAALDRGEIPGLRVGKRWVLSTARLKAHCGFEDTDVLRACAAVAARKAARKEAA